MTVQDVLNLTVKKKAIIRKSMQHEWVFALCENEVIDLVMKILNKILRLPGIAVL